MTTEEELANLSKTIAGHERRLMVLEGLFKEKKGARMKETSIKEFLLSKQPKGDVQKLLAIGYYLEKQQGLTSFTVEDLKKGFRSAAEPVPINVSDTIRKNKAKGHLMDSGENREGSRSYMVTTTGERTVEAGFKSK